MKYDKVKYDLLKQIEQECLKTYFCTTEILGNTTDYRAVENWTLYIYFNETNHSIVLNIDDKIPYIIHFFNLGDEEIKERSEKDEKLIYSDLNYYMNKIEEFFNYAVKHDKDLKKLTDGCLFPGDRNIIFDGFIYPEKRP